MKFEGEKDNKLFIIMMWSILALIVSNILYLITTLMYDYIKPEKIKVKKVKSHTVIDVIQANV